MRKVKKIMKMRKVKKIKKMKRKKKVRRKKIMRVMVIKKRRNKMGQEKMKNCINLGLSFYIELLFRNMGFLIIE